ncbi:MAG: phosphonopyruvate decarboxylase [Deltaproteobacteria bacterium]|nr:phosphonopyruvate decarboxylase [Deltaproteobacteria bacterium]
MIQAKDFIEPALERGYRFWSGVPCSFLTPFINYVIQNKELRYVGASSEGEAVAIAIGSYLAGNKSVAICQNSGLGNMVNPLTSLNYPFRIPLLLIVTHRGAPGIQDEPQHVLMGQITEKLLETMRIPYLPFPEEGRDVQRTLAEVENYIEKENLPFALIMKKDAVTSYPLEQKITFHHFPVSPVEGKFYWSGDSRMRRLEAIQIIKETASQRALLIATTGKTGRELFALGHQSNQIYIVGGMGCAAGIGLGLSLGQPSKKVLVLDGDGAVLMKMGTLATIGHYQPKNLIHIVLDNEAHESTGAQFTVSGSTDIASVASACRYRKLFRCDQAKDLKRYLDLAMQSEGPVMIHVKIAVGSDPKLGRPTLTPHEVKDQFVRRMNKERSDL